MLKPDVGEVADITYTVCYHSLSLCVPIQGKSLHTVSEELDNRDKFPVSGGFWSCGIGNLKRAN